MAREKKPKPVHTAAELGLDITTGDDDLFRWFLLCYLFAKPIQATVAINTWHVFIDRKLDTPWAILEIPHRQLVHVLDEGKYARYGEVTANGLHRCMERLISDYEGSLVLMFESSQNEDQFSKRLQTLFGVGPKMAEIFMAETEELFARRVE